MSIDPEITEKNPKERILKIPPPPLRERILKPPPVGLIDLTEKQVAATLECAQLFEYNVDKDEWMQLWMDADPEKDKRLAEHMWGKLTQRTTAGGTLQLDLLNTIGHSDFHVHRIISRMVLMRCEKHGPRRIAEYLLK